MPSFVSKLGQWSPAKESVTMKNTFGKTIESEFIVGPDGSHVVKEGENFLYTGEDREAVKILREEGEEYLGRDFRTDPEFLQAIRNMGFNTVKEYLKHIGFDEKKEVSRQEALMAIVNTHELPEKRQEILELAGGKDFTGNRKNNVIGGFGTERLRSPEEIPKTPRGKKK